MAESERVVYVDRKRKSYAIVQATVKATYLGT